jgi:hypothetical protein
MNKEITSSLNKTVNQTINKINNQDSSKIQNIIIIALIICALFFIIYYIINHTNIYNKKETETHTYNITKGNLASPYLDVCKKGCTRGVCRTKNSNSKELCKYDFQCNYCKDRNTKNFYVDLTNYEEVQPIYSVQEELNNKQRNSLNVEIEENNDYIDDLNDKIRKYNESN